MSFYSIDFDRHPMPRSEDYVSPYLRRPLRTLEQAQADIARRKKPWTEAEDRILLTRGPAYGYGAVAERELGRTERAGHRRFQKLTKE